MKIILEIFKNNNSKLFLSWEKGIESEKIFLNHGYLSRDLLVKMDFLLGKHSLNLDKISGYTIISDVPDEWTNYRVAKITLEGLMVARINRDLSK